MAARCDLTKKFAREYVKADRVEKGEILDALVASTGWTRDHARRAIRTAHTREGAAGAQQRKPRPRPRKYSYDALVVLQEVWRLAGHPSGKYLAAVMDDTLKQLVRFREIGKVAERVTDAVLDEVQAISATTIDRYLNPHKDAAYRVALSGTNRRISCGLRSPPAPAWTTRSRSGGSWCLIPSRTAATPSKASSCASSPAPTR